MTERPGTPVNFRPHHFLCALGFVGKGYSERFAANMSEIVEGRLRAPDGDQVEIHVAEAADDICAPCPHRRGKGCSRQARIDGLDRRHAAALEYAPGDTVTWGAAKRRIAERLTPNDLDRICAGCQWLPLGVCKSALSRLLRGEGESA